MSKKLWSISTTVRNPDRLGLKQNNKNLSHKQFQKLLEDIVTLKDNVSDSNEWVKNIPSVIKTFKEELLCS